MRKQQGFILPVAIFIIVVLAALSSFVISINALTTKMTGYSLQITKADFATRSGLEWVTFRTVTDGTCPATTTLNLTQAGLNGFSVVVTCSEISYTETPNTLKIHTVQADATYGTLGDLDYVKKAFATVLITGV